MAFDPYLRQMAEIEKMLTVKVVCLDVLYHPSNFLPSLKNTLYNGLKIVFGSKKYLGKCYVPIRGSIIELL